MRRARLWYSKLWRAAYRFGVKQKTLAFGIYPAASLKAWADYLDNLKESGRVLRLSVAAE